MGGQLTMQAPNADPQLLGNLEGNCAWQNVNGWTAEHPELSFQFFPRRLFTTQQAVLQFIDHAGVTNQQIS